MNADLLSDSCTRTRFSLWWILIYFCSTANALKIVPVSPLQLLQQADLVVVARIVKSSQPWSASVVQVIKPSSELNQPFPQEISFRVENDNQRYTPHFSVGDSNLLFLVPTGTGIFRCVGYGKQGVWPKMQPEWPYGEEHVSSLDASVKAFSCMQAVMNESHPNTRDKLLADALTTGDRLLKSIAQEYVTKAPMLNLPLSRAAMDVISTELANTPNQFKTPKSKEAPETELPGALSTENPTSSTPRSIIVMLTAVTIGLLWLLLKRRW